ncbi:Transcriptional regulator, MarR family [Labilithrix luteola]|uniref:Transcriptional regulator, MarR family n=1 Tax=Labilithrix luteola TaxID=1391654 RepID=A0A0K1Q400_9BACT|nr:MarR family transcriptional regulator [Labilithrix luteola]AKV00367.1 Transcriptional regulator, MarR family [Labilithrix luteola]
MSTERRKRSEVLANDLREVASNLVRRLRAESADASLSLSQSAVMVRLLKFGPATVAELARAEHVKPQSMGATVASLEELGFVLRTADPDDARRWNASLTDSGKRTFLAGRAARQAWLSSAIEARLDDEEQRQLATALAVLRKVVEP